MRIAIALTAVGVLLLAGCSTFAVPNTPRQGLAAAEASFTATVQALDANCQSKVIAWPTCERMKPVVQGADVALDAAGGAIAANETGEFTAYLTVAVETISQIQAVLSQRGIKVVTP